MAAKAGSTSPQEASDKEKKKQKLNAFLNDMLRVGCVRGFKYFKFYLRGREELVITVLNDAKAVNNPSPASSLTAGQPKKHLPRNEQSFMLSANTQRHLSGYGYINVGLPPASPSEREIILGDGDSTVFLLAGYARYACPYVWVRSNHDRLIRLSGSTQAAKDNPLKLNSTTIWATDPIQVWDIIAELVDVCTSPPPLNPFAVDYGFFDGLPLFERALAIGSMVNFLQRVLDSGDHRYDLRLAEDIKALTERHFEDMLQWRIERPDVFQQVSEDSNGSATHVVNGPK